MKMLIGLLSVILVAHALPTKPEAGTADKLEGLPWIKASQAKTRFGAPPPPTSTEGTPNLGNQAAVGAQSGPQQPQLIQSQPDLNNELLQNYIAALAARIQSSPVPNQLDAAKSQQVLPAPPIHPLKAKVPKQLKPQDSPIGIPTTENYWAEEKKEYPDSLYDEFYLDWLRKRQLPEIPNATPNPMGFYEPDNSDPAPATASNPASPANAPYLLPPPYPAVPMAMNPFANPFLYPFAGFKLSKAMQEAQVNAALAAYNITTTAKPIKIKLKIPIPAGSDLAQVVASGMAGFPSGTTYELSKK